MQLKSFRIKLIKLIIDFNERVIFERRLLNFYKGELKGELKTIIDVGANKGQSIDFFLKLNPSCVIYALEPNPALFQLLQNKYRNHTNVKLFNFGISNHSGEKLFFENVLDYTSSFESLNEDSKYLKKKAAILGVKTNEIITSSYNVDVLTLSDFISQFNIAPSIDILKIDTEGHEFYCLEGFFNSPSPINVKYIQLENHNDDMYSNRVPYASIRNLLENNNFKEFKLVRHGFGNLDEVIFKNAVN